MEALESIIADYYRRTEEWEQAMRQNIPGFSREDEDEHGQPCDDEHMGTYDNLCEERDTELAAMLFDVVRKLEAIVSADAEDNVTVYAVSDHSYDNGVWCRWSGSVVSEKYKAKHEKCPSGCKASGINTITRPADSQF